MRPQVPVITPDPKDPEDPMTVSTDTFAADWAEWRAAHERQRADPHGFLAVTHLHWLDASPTRVSTEPPAAGARRTTSSAWFCGPENASSATDRN